MRKKKRNKSVRSIYIFGLVWLLYSIFFSLSGFWEIVKCCCLAAIIAGIFSGKHKEKSDEDKAKDSAAAVPQRKASDSVKKTQSPQKTSVREPTVPEDEVVLLGRQYVTRIQALNEEIPDYKISAQLKQIEILTDTIIDQVEKKREKQKEIRRFINYYLPTTIKLLEQYVQLQNVGLQGENIQNGMVQIEGMLDNVIVALQKQLDNLFERDIVDITADIQVMEQMMKAQGLTNKSDF